MWAAQQQGTCRMLSAPPADVAGVPGTGKTATIRSVVSALQERASGGEIKSFRFLEVNGMKIADPAQSFTILWEFISGARLPAKQALAALEKHFKTPNPGRDTWWACSSLGMCLADDFEQRHSCRRARSAGHKKAGGHL